MPTLKERFLSEYPTALGAVQAFMAGLMAGDPASFQQGYSVDNAFLAARDTFGDALDAGKWAYVANVHGVSPSVSGSQTS